MENVTLESNCIIALEKNEETAPYVRKLIQLNKVGKINLRVVAISASEKLPNRRYLSNFNKFLKRIKDVGLSDAEILNPICYLDMSYWDHCVLAGGKLSSLEKDVQKIIHPTYEMTYADHCKKHGYQIDDLEKWEKWVNVKCDVLAMWSHIRHNGDIFVTVDDHFLRSKKSKLIELGAGDILKPDQAVTKLK